MVATTPSAPPSPAGPSAQGRSAPRSASDRQGATEVSPENVVFEHLARRRPDHTGATCIGRPRPHRGDWHRGRRRFSGQTRDGRYCRARYYHPTLQRFISEDPIGLAAGDVNFYGYVANNPLSFIDPLGLDRRPACDFAQTYTRVLKANVNETNALLFSPGATAVKTVGGLAFGTGTVVARSTGTVSPFDAVKSVVWHHRGVANLTIGATLASAAVNWGVNAGLSAVALEVGIITGSSYVALGQALAQCGF